MGVLSGKTALVTGGSRGIGRGIAERLAKDGALVAVHYGRNETAAKETVSAIEAAGGRAFAFRAELGTPGDAEALWAAFDERIEQVDGRSGLDILVHNAGISLYGGIEDAAEPGFDELFAVNVKAPFFITRHGLSRLRDGGRIINISSGATRIAMPMITAYSMTKGALDVLTRTLAQDLGSRGITVNAVAPGVVETDMVSFLADPAARAWAEGFSVFGRVGRPADIGDIVAFLASDSARWITGQVIDATGGSHLGPREAPAA
jgi:3-oxoacyl-[acyl-carrier protein] reductase